MCFSVRVTVRAVVSKCAMHNACMSCTHSVTHEQQEGLHDFGTKTNGFCQEFTQMSAVNSN